MNFICSYGTPFILDLKVNQGGRKLGAAPKTGGAAPQIGANIFVYLCWCLISGDIFH